jgi:hypothetical protein
MLRIGECAKAPRPVHRARDWVEARGLGEGVSGFCGQPPHVAETHFLGTGNMNAQTDGRRRRVADDSAETIPRRASSRSFEANPSRLSTPKRIEVTAIRISAETATNRMVASMRWTPNLMLPGAGER